MPVLRRIVFAAVPVALVAAAVASAAIGSSRQSGQDSVSTSLLMPGVTYSRDVDFTSRGPIVLDVVTAPKPDGKVYSLAPALSNNTLTGREALTSLDTRVAAGATSVAINGDYFDNGTGAPSGLLMQNGVLESAPAVGRSSLGIGTDGTLTTAQVSSAGIWQGSGQRRPMLLNVPTGKFTLFTPTYGTATPKETGAVVEDVIGTLPPAHLDVPLDGTVTQVTAAGSTPIPSGGAVLVARGTVSTAQLKSEAPVGQLVEAQLSLSPDWSGLASAIGGGPLLVKNGKPIFQTGELFNARQLNGRQARGAIGQLANGNIVFVSVEGTKPAYSIGMSSYELAVALSRLGAVTAYGLGAGSAAGLAFDGTLLTRPSTGTTPKVSDALVLSYMGIYAAQPSAPVLSPNGDGFGDTETLSYRVVRPSQVVATLSGPSGTQITLANEAESPGVHTLTWNGTKDGSLAPEGKWTFTLSGTDDRNITTTATRPFSLDDTLSSLAVQSGSGTATASFKLTRAATILVQVERLTGVPVATLRSGKLAAGAQHLTWKGKSGGRGAPSGRYQVAVQATSAVGTSTLLAPFSFRAHKH